MAEVQKKDGRGQLAAMACFLRGCSLHTEHIIKGHFQGMEKKKKNDERASTKEKEEAEEGGRKAGGRV